jgi:hypothetical protein
MKVRIEKQGVDNYRVYFNGTNKELDTKGIVGFIKKYANEIDGLDFEENVPNKIKLSLQSYYETLKEFK